MLLHFFFTTSEIEADVTENSIATISLDSETNDGTTKIKVEDKKEYKNL